MQSKLDISKYLGVSVRQVENHIRSAKAANPQAFETVAKGKANKLLFSDEQVKLIIDQSPSIPEIIEVDPELFEDDDVQTIEMSTSGMVRLETPSVANPLSFGFNESNLRDSIQGATHLQLANMRSANETLIAFSHMMGVQTAVTLLHEARTIQANSAAAFATALKGKVEGIVKGGE